MMDTLSARTDAIARARQNAPFLRELLARHADVAAVFETSGGIRAADAALDIPPVEAGARLRLQRQRLALAVALSDLAGEWSLEDVTRSLSAFADTAIEQALAAVMADRRSDAGPAGFAVIALGKLGSRELNYSSDVDLLFLFDPDTLPCRPREEPGKAAIRIGQRVIDMLQSRTADGYVARVDMRLRPAPEVTPVALSLNAALSHYESSALAWERAAFIRARACAGDLTLGQRFLDAIAPFVWRRSLDFGVVDEIRAISRRIRDHYGDRQAFGPGFDLKRGRGGIREIEFFVQIEQLIHGGRDPALRPAATGEALRALAGARKLDADSATALGDAYEALRTIEHRVQMIDDQQTHLLPADAAALDRVARLQGLADGPALLGQLRPHVETVARLFGAVAGEAGETRLTRDPGPLTSKLAALGFRDATSAAARVMEWRSGRARSLRSSAARDALEAMLPPILGAIGQGPDPDRALNRLSDLIERLSSGVNLYRLVAARPDLGQTLAAILGQAPALADQLSRRPDLLDTLLDESAFAEPLSADAVVAALGDLDRMSFEQALDRARRWINERRFALGAQVVTRTRDPLRIAAGYAALAEGAVRVLADVTQREFAQRHGRVRGGGLAILGLGRLGGGALTHASDLDLIFLFDAPDGARSDGGKPLGATDYYNRLASRIAAALSVSTGAGALYDVDTRLRPQGEKGLLAVRLDAFADYQRHEAWVFEHMALTRARVLHGCDDLRRAIETVLQDVLARRDRDKVVADASAMRAEMAAHKPAGGPWDLKLADGGLVDLEFAVHATQLTRGVGIVPQLGDAIGLLEAEGLAPAGMREHHDLLTRALVVLRLVVPDGGEPVGASRDLLAAVCDAPCWPALLAAIGEARQEIAAWWHAIRDGKT